MCYRFRRNVLPRRWLLRSILFCVLAGLPAAANPGRATSARFDVYAEAGQATAESLLLWFERLHAYFLKQTGLTLVARPPVRVIAFGSRGEYDAYRLRPTADAYYVGASSRDYIVMTSAGSEQARIAAHEYAHFVLRAAGLDLPAWLNEGLAEFFSMVRPGESAGAPSAEPAHHLRILRSRPWMPLGELLNLPAESPLRDDHQTSELFYSECWALADMLLSSAEYSPRFPALLATTSGAAPGPQAVTALYDRPLEKIEEDLRAWVRQRTIAPLPVPTLNVATVTREVAEVSPFAWRASLADLLLTLDKLDRAQAAYRDLEREAPEDPDILAALAVIDLRKGDATEGRRHWKRALEFGLADAVLCYRYGMLAQMASLPPQDVRPAFERALAFDPGFDDARFSLALIENNAGNYERAVKHLRAMRSVAPARQYHYWIALAYAANELGRREEAQAAATEAARRSTTASQRVYAAQLFEIAQTDVAVQVTRDANGTLRMAHTRIPHGTADWNPFVEPDDRIRRIDASLQNVDCAGATLRITVASAGQTFVLAIPDPGHVQIRNGPPEWVCGPQRGGAVTVVYAASGNGTPDSGFVRGIDFH